MPFPRAAALAPPARLARPVPEALVFEPHDASADALVRLLTELGVRATRVATAGDGLAALDAHPAGFAAAFVSLDTIDATPFVDVLQQHPAARRTTFVAVAAAGHRGGLDLDRVGPSFRLTRPIRRARLVECLDAMSARVPGSGARTANGRPPARRRTDAGSRRTDPRRRRLLRQPAAGHAAARNAAATPSRSSPTARPPSTRRSIVPSTSCSWTATCRAWTAMRRPRASAPSSRPPDADPGDDRQRFARGPRRVPARRDGRLPGEADPGGSSSPPSNRWSALGRGQAAPIALDAARRPLPGGTR